MFHWVSGYYFIYFKKFGVKFKRRKYFKISSVGNNKKEAIEFTKRYVACAGNKVEKISKVERYEDENKNKINT